MTDVEFEERLAYVEHDIDRLYAHVLRLSGALLMAVMFIAIALFL